ncbi:MAG: transporter substrate-binding domain-containing protein [Clostridia bacterium]|nr:transporter substrate-binding domain-containing protein [Clostridia bacterium]
MKKTVKTVAALLAAVMLVFSSAAMLSSCASYRTLDKIKAAGELIVYTEGGFAPYEFVYNNELVGVDISVMAEVAKEIGVKLTVKDVNFDTIIGAVQSGKADIGAAGITINEERKGSVDFSVPYSSTEQYVIVKADGEIPTVEALAGKQIGVQQGTTSDFMIDGLIKDGIMAGATSTGYTTPALAAAAIGKIDAVVTDKLTAQIIVAGSNGSLQTAKLVKADGSDAAEVEEYGYCVAKGNAELLEVINKVVKRLLDDGTINTWTEEFNAKAGEG